jgi:hypothetical protein
MQESILVNGLVFGPTGSRDSRTISFTTEAYRKILKLIADDELERRQRRRVAEFKQSLLIYQETKRQLIRSLSKKKLLKGSV